MLYRHSSAILKIPTPRNLAPYGTYIYIKFLKILHVVYFIIDTNITGLQLIDGKKNSILHYFHTCKYSPFQCNLALLPDIHLVQVRVLHSSI